MLFIMSEVQMKCLEQYAVNMHQYFTAFNTKLRQVYYISIMCAKSKQLNYITKTAHKKN